MPEDHTFLTKARALRPFYLIVVVWGKHHTDFLLNFCITSLLSPNNIPALLNSGNKFLIATTDEDWACMQTRPIFQLLKQYIEPVFIRIPPCSPEANKYLHMGIGHKLATQMAFNDSAYAAILTSDLIVSDGTVAALQRHAVNGIEVVLTVALRFGEEPLFENLSKIGVATIDSRFGDEATPLVATSRQLVSAGIRGFHSQTLSYEWESAYFSDFPVAVWWRVPGEDGVILHSLSWAPLLIDYAALEHHDSSVMDDASIDSDYIHRNFALNGKVYVVRDSDEIMLVSWSPLDADHESLEPKRKFSHPLTADWNKGKILYETLLHPAFDPLKRKIFMGPVYWHANELDRRVWDATAKKTRAILQKYGLHVGLQGMIAGFPFAFKNFIARTHYIPSACSYYWRERRKVLGLMMQALKGDSGARKRVKHSFQVVINGLTGLFPKAKNTKKQ